MIECSLSALSNRAATSMCGYQAREMWLVELNYFKLPHELVATVLDSTASRPHISVKYGPDVTLLARKGGMHVVTYTV